MFCTVKDFISTYREDSAAAQKIFDALTDESLATTVAEGHRTLGRLAWHVVQSVSEILHDAGLQVDRSSVDLPVPTTAREIAQAYVRVTRDCMEALERQWDDAELARERPMYGEQWSGAKVLLCVYGHEAHHRGQMSVLMRQAGLVPYGIYGPHKEAWASMGMEPPPI